MENPKHATETNIALLVKNLLEKSRMRFHRHCVILAGAQPWCHASLKKIAEHNALNNLLAAATTPLDISNSRQINPSDAPHYLGHEYEHAVIDFFDGIDPNALGSLSGSISGGGLLILLMPPLETLQDFADPEQQRMAIWPYDAKNVGRRFLQRLKKIIANSGDVTLIQENQPLPDHSATADTADLKGYLQNDVCRTVDQKRAVDAIGHVVRGHRRRPLVITANRGRGKSAALGISAAKLLQQGVKRIIVTGPRLNAAGTVFKHARTLLNDALLASGSIVTSTGCLEYIAPDVLCRETPACNLLLIDEAAAVPVPILHRLLQRYSRIVFATTTYGYEGTGRGFTVKFQETLDRETPGWHALEMELPIRWAPDDPVERFVFQCLLLDATVAETGFAFDAHAITVTKLNRATLIEDENLLSAIFGLLVLAHYQTQPRDLRYLLDAIDLDIFVASCNGVLVGTALVELEGNLDKTIADAVHRNERRVMGHLLPQTLESFAGLRHASQVKYARIVRIAVHPGFRRQGIGHQLLQHIETDAHQRQVDIAGSSFGADSSLLSFWHSAAYFPAHLGLKHNAATGTHAISYIKALSDQGGKFVEAAVAKFNSRFSFMLAEAYQDLECDVAAKIYKTFTQGQNLQLSKDEWNDITSFATAGRGYEINSFPITKLISHLFEQGKIDRLCSFDEQCILMKKVLQRLSWQEIITTLGLKGKRDAIAKLRETLCKLINDESVKHIIKIADQ
ncbi:MAG: GNAT family N-acetyltransferase [Gammaproteobacteria bacterium]|nr:GNAT family N-acetyltransferase [Gammaproteobacteria bacterium]